MAQAPYPVLTAPPRGAMLGCGPQPGRQETSTSNPIWTCTGWGLPSRSCYHAAGALLPHRFTLTGHTFRHGLGGLLSVALAVPCGPRGYLASCPVVFGLSSAPCKRSDHAHTAEATDGTTKTRLEPSASGCIRQVYLFCSYLYKLSNSATIPLCGKAVPS